MNIDKQIEFDKVKEIGAELAVTDYAKELIEKVGTPPLQNITEIRDVLMIVEKGDCLTPYQLEQ